MLGRGRRRGLIDRSTDTGDGRGRGGVDLRSSEGGTGRLTYSCTRSGAVAAGASSSASRHMGIVSSHSGRRDPHAILWQ